MNFANGEKNHRYIPCKCEKRMKCINNDEGKLAVKSENDKSRNDYTEKTLPQKRFTGRQKAYNLTICMRRKVLRSSKVSVRQLHCNFLVNSSDKR